MNRAAAPRLWLVNMGHNGWSSILARLRPPPGRLGDAVADAELLRRYAETGDAAAFELLVWRHGPLVLGTCRRVTRHDADAEDAFQATFLILARKAGGVRQSLPGFLHRTARRAALRAMSRRREVSLSMDLPATPRSSLDADELALIDAEIDNLGERHRRVVVLCYLQGHTAEDAATILGVPRGTVLSRLATARARLAANLTRRGVTLPTLLATSSLSAEQVLACVNVTLNPRLAAPAAAIAQGVLTMMLRHQIAVTAAALTLVGIGLTGTGVALIPQAGGKAAAPIATKSADKPPAIIPAPATAKSEEAESRRVEKLRAQYDQMNDVIQQHDRMLLEQHRKTPPMSDAMLKAKTELLMQLESMIFKAEVEARPIELTVSETVGKLRSPNLGVYKDDEINQIVSSYAAVVKSASQLKAKRSMLGEWAKKDSGVAAKLLSELDAEVKKIAIYHTKLIEESRKDAVEHMKRDAKENLESSLTIQKTLLAGQMDYIKFLVMKRDKLALEISDGSASRVLSPGTDGIRYAKAARDIVERQLLQATYGDAASAAPDDRLSRILSELAELRAEVKLLRERK